MKNEIRHIGQNGAQGNSLPSAGSMAVAGGATKKRSEGVNVLAAAEPAWVKECSRVAPEWKQAIALYAATHLIEYGDVIQIGSGTTLNAFMDNIIDRQRTTKIALDLIILTSNLQVLAKGREAQSSDQSIFGSTQIILTGGALQVSLDSLMGEYAAKGVSTEFIYPRTTFFGARGLSFVDELTIRYQFEEEISTQTAYATRPTGRRVLLCDHTKLGKKAGWKAGLTVESLLSNTDTCYVISTLPNDDSDESAQAIKVVEHEEQELESQLRRLLESDSAGKYAEKEFALRLVGPDGEVKREVSLSAVREELSKKTS